MMTWENLNRTNEAPSSGRMLVYLKTKVLFDEYQTLDDVAMTLAGHEILEIHLFDQFKEYRALLSESRRFKEGFIEHIADFDISDEASFYAENVLLEDGKMLTVLNHISYDDNGMAFIDDYRLKMRRE